MYRRVLCVVAHPDDAEIGAGGALAKLSRAGHSVFVLCLTTSEKQPHLTQVRRAAAQASAELLGIELSWLDDGRHHQVEEIAQFELIRQMDYWIETLRPDTVITHAEEDSHLDHRLTYQAVLASSRRWRASLLTFPPAERHTPAYLRHVPNVFVNIDATIETKLEALALYEYEGQSFRKLETEAMRIRARYFGSLCACSYAEVFTLVRTDTFF